VPAPHWHARWTSWTHAWTARRCRQRTSHTRVEIPGQGTKHTKVLVAGLGGAWSMSKSDVPQTWTEISFRLRRKRACCRYGQVWVIASCITVGEVMSMRSEHQKWWR
jgi:hypothetical protein